MDRKRIERARADLRRAWQAGDDNLMAAAQLVLLKELRRAGFRGEKEIKKMSGGLSHMGCFYCSDASSLPNASAFIKMYLDKLFESLRNEKKHGKRTLQQQPCAASNLTERRCNSG
jgi:hypothetical protein